MKKLFKWMVPFIWILLIVCALTIIIPITQSYVPQFIKYIFQTVIPNESMAGSSNTLPKFILEFFRRFEKPATVSLVVAISLVIYQALRGILMFANGYFKGLLAEKISFNMRKQLYEHIQDLSFTYHKNADTGDLIQRCTSDIDTIKSFLSTLLPDILYIVASLVSGAIQMSNINVTLMLLTLCVIPITMTASVIFYRYIEKKFDEIEKYESSMTSCIQENVNGVRVVKAFATEQDEINKFDEKNDVYRDANINVNKKFAMYWGFSDGITSLQYAVTIGFCIYLASKNAVDTSDLITCISYIGMLVYPARNLGRIVQGFGKAIVANKRVCHILEEPSEYENDGTLEPEIKGNISLQHVAFKFSDGNDDVLTDINFDIKAGQTIAIVGKTGCGKSTLAHILTRLLDYDEGHIYVDGVELKDIKKKHIRQNVGMLLQEPFLYARSIYDNVSIAKPSATCDEVYKATKTAAIHEDILNFDKKYATLVGEKGATLSGGQKQRISIARMLLLEKPIIIFDDSLSAVDTETDQEIRASLNKLQKKPTTIIITHRITTAKEADKIIVIDDGKVSESGTHEELVKENGLYASLWKIQGSFEDQFNDLVKEAE